MHLLQSLATTTLLTGFCLTQTWNASGPGLRAISDIFYDPVRQETVLFGTAAPSTQVDPNDFSWIWNGTHWRRSSATTAPPTATFQGCYTDAQNGYIALAHTSPATTWRYSGNQWTQVLTAHVPPRRHAFGIAYDQARQRVVVFGGSTQFGNANDTWEFDGVDWRSVGSLPAPPARYGHALGYDPLRQRLVLQGGFHQNFQPLNDTWEWVAGTWQAVATPNQPPFTRPLLWYPPRQRLVQFAGNGGYEFTGSDWQSFATPAVEPSSPLRVWDSARQRLVQIGRDFQGYEVLCDEVWELAGASWQPGVQGPPRRLEAVLASDFVRNELVLYDGQQAWQRGPSGWAAHAPGAPQLREPQIVHDPARDRFLVYGKGLATAELWSLQGASWTRLTPAQLPPKNLSLVLAFDSVRGVLVGHGPYAFSGPVSSATWEFDGVDWRQIATPRSPGTRRGFAMVFDASLGACVLYGGNDGTLTPLADTWLYDGSGWQQRFTANGPPGLQDHAMAYDPWRGRTVLHGGFDGYNPLLEHATWEFDGVDWTPLPTTGERIQRRRHALAIDPLRGSTVALGGTADFPGELPAAARSFDLVRPLAATVARYGPGCAPAGSSPVLDAAPGSAPQRGNTLVLTVDSANAPAASFLALGFRIDRWQGQPLPLALDPLGLPGCTLWLAAEASLGSLVQHQGPIGAHLLPLPGDPALAGTRFAAQALVFGANSSHTTLSNAVLVTVQ